jgi:ABC-type branched-subunit amino acid transport system ATPase component
LLGVSALMVALQARQALAVSDCGCILDGGCVVMLGAAH